LPPESILQNGFQAVIKSIAYLWQLTEQPGLYSPKNYVALPRFENYRTPGDDDILP
jgi:hypothetical protein